MTTSNDISQQGDRIAKAIDEYLLLKEQGQQPSHSEFAARYPDISEPLVECLQSVDFMNHASASFWGAPADETNSKTLGDFRLERELGRGGMGVVYEAEQISLERRVAVKVLPFASLLDKRQLKRFQNEARAAAILQHPNIVSVHSVGCERGVHFYAMELIDGQSLAEVIHALRADPSTSSIGDTRPIAALSTLRSGQRTRYFHRVAELGIQAANALDYAHQEGVIHRDIKPSNLLLDDTGQLHIADFGLARIQSTDSVTASQDVVGTLRYMSPEQSEGRYIDHRTDIYSLGVSLFELLTLRPALDSEDRRALCRQLAEAQPIQLRSIDANIPRDLELIVLKATSPSADDRYQSSRELSDDLGRFLSSEPVHAQRPGRFDHVTRWVQRNRLLASLIVTVALLLSTVSVVAPIFAVQYAQIANERASALSAESNARAAEAKARAEADKGNANTQRILVDVLGKALTMLERTEGNDEVLRPLLDQGRAEFEKLMNDPSLRPEQRRDLARSLTLLGCVMQFRFDEQAATEMQATAVRVLEDIAEELPHDSEHKLALFESYGNLSRRYRDLDLAHKARNVAAELVRQFPDELEYKFCELWGQVGVADQLRFGKHAHREPDIRGAEVAYRKALAGFQAINDGFPNNLEARGGVCWNTYQLAKIHLLRGELDRAENAYRKVLSLRMAGVTIGKDGYNVEARFESVMANANMDLASILLSNHPGEAEEFARDGVAGFETMDEAYPQGGYADNVRNARHVLAEAHLHQGNVKRGLDLLEADRPTFHVGRIAERLWRSGKRELARMVFEMCIEHGEDNLRSYLLASCYDESLHDYTIALDLAERCARIRETHNDLQHLGVAHYRRGNWQDAIEAIIRGTDIGEADAFDHFFLAMAYAQLGNEDAAGKQYQFGQQKMDGTLNRIGPSPSHFEVEQVHRIAEEAASVIASHEPSNQ